MKTQGKITDVQTWEKRKEYGGIERIENAEAEYDFLIVRMLDDKRTARQKVKDMFKDKTITIDQTILYFGILIPVKRPHEFKIGDSIIIDMTVRLATTND